MPNGVWNYPSTWHVGDTLNAANLNTRLGDQNSILLRRPLTVAHVSTGSSIKVSGSGNTNLLFDVIDQDDDGMVIDEKSWPGPLWVGSGHKSDFGVWKAP